MTLNQLFWATVADLRFATCQHCLNEQPFVQGRSIPDCESCGEPITCPACEGNTDDGLCYRELDLSCKRCGIEKACAPLSKPVPEPISPDPST